MGNLIAVTGSPGSGKTTVAVKLAKHLYDKDHKPVIVLSPDLYVPIMPVLFPRKSHSLASLGRVLERTEITQGDLLQALVTAKEHKDFGVLGYRRGENLYSYPEPTPDKVAQLLEGVRQLAHTVVLDTTTRREDRISQAGLAAATRVVHLVVPDVKCLAYELSLGQELYEPTRTLSVLHRLQREVPGAEEEVLEYFRHPSMTVPYAREVLFQSMTGQLLDKTRDKKYGAAMAALAEAVIT